MAKDPSRSKVIQGLAEQLRRIERSQRRFVAANGSATLSSGIRALDRLLPEEGFGRGTIVEWLADGQGTGVATLAILAARQATATGGAFVVIDPQQQFYPPAAAGWGINLDHTTIVRTNRTPDTLWALEQSLQCTGVAAAWCWVDRLNNRMFRRLQLAAETGGGIGLLLRPAATRRGPSWADVRLLVQPLPSQSDSCGRRLRIELLHCRGGMSGQSLELEISDETSDVHLVPQLAAATCAERAAGA